METYGSILVFFILVTVHSMSNIQAKSYSVIKSFRYQILPDFVPDQSLVGSYSEQVQIVGECAQLCVQHSNNLFLPDRCFSFSLEVDSRGIITCTIYNGEDIPPLVYNPYPKYYQMVSRMCKITYQHLGFGRNRATFKCLNYIQNTNFKYCTYKTYFNISIFYL